MMPSIKLDDEPIGLLYVTFETERRCYILTRSMERVKAGRHSSCDIQIIDSSMSKDHFAINISSSRQPGGSGEKLGFELEDLKSFNKTKLNREVIDKGALDDGDIVEAGFARFEFHRLVS
jgi:pSer/pThr/pTyr-binding forkhead associated (FHA) protein